VADRQGALLLRGSGEGKERQVGGKRQAANGPANARLGLVA
jgi:hypothetical protein